MNILDVVIIKNEQSQYGVLAGEQGVITEILLTPYKAYLVEVCDSNGETVAEFPLKEEELELANPV